MSKSIKLKPAQWDKLRSQLMVDNKPSVMLIRSKMQSVLGFVDRTHSRWDEEKMRMKTEIHLDFFNEPKRTMFLLKYSEYLDGREKAN